MALNIEDELSRGAAGLRLRKLRFKRRFRQQIEKSTRLSRCCVGAVEREQCGRGAASRD